MKHFTLNLIISIILLQSIHIAYSQRRLRCRSGTILVNGTTCVGCQPGTFQEEDQCVPCPPGTFIQFAFARFCRPCPIGRFSSTFGMERCEFCPRDSAARNEGSAECTSSCRSGCPQCAPGFGYDAGSNQCRKCAPGTISSVFSATPCFPCGTRSVPNEDQTKCICPPGLLRGFKMASGSCVKCPSGASSPDGLRCVCEPGRIPERFAFSRDLARCRCPLGTIGVNETCVECTPRNIRRGECNLCSAGRGVVNDRCERCRGNTVSRNRDLEPCEECPDGFVPNRSNSDCMCPRGMGLTEDGSCEICQPGFAVDSFEGICFACSTRGGISREPGSTRCRTCPLGWEPNETGTRCIRE